MCFPIEGKMKEEVERIYNHVLKYEMFDINDTLLVPHAILGESFDDRLKRIQGYDVEELRRQCNYLLIQLLKNTILLLIKTNL